MKKLAERVRRALWLYRQPLTRVPETGAPISDLFIWRNSPEWSTHFELLDLAALMGGKDSGQQNSCTVCLFDAEGRPIAERELPLKKGRRQTIAISELLPADCGSMGTFSIFHSHTPTEIATLGSFLTERGYVSYRHRNAPLRSYVHGNLDAVARCRDATLQFLGTGSLFRRDYRLQRILTGPASYEVAIVNPTARRRTFQCRILDITHGRTLATQRVQLNPAASHAFMASVTAGSALTVVVESRLVMSRPLVFCSTGDSVDVFHG